MKPTVYPLLILALLCPLLSRATGDSLYFVLPTDSVIVHQDPLNGHLIFEHGLSPGQTLYGATRFYGLSLEEVYTLNPKLRIDYEAGDVMRVSIPKSVIRPGYGPDSAGWYAPVYYEVGKGETLFGITRRSLGHPDETLLTALNPGLSPATMSVGQKLLAGYFRITGIHPDAQIEVIDPYVLRNRGMKELWDVRTRGKRLKTQNGKAAWTSKGDRNKWMVLHRTAPIGSLIELEDPRSRKTLYARVTARIPDKLDKDVIVVVSPLLVRAFGVRDKRFYLRTRHF